MIVLFDRTMHRLRGFSTLKNAEVNREDGTRCRAVYSGDTVVEKAYWGQKVLGVAFLKYLWGKTCASISAALLVPHQ